MSSDEFSEGELPDGGAVLLDTNALMAVEGTGIDLFRELERVAPELRPVVPSGVVRELRGIESAAGGAEARGARVALGLVEGLPRVETSGEVDDELLRLGEERGWSVLTSDAELKERLKEAGVPVIYIRQGSHLERSVD